MTTALPLDDLPPRLTVAGQAVAPTFLQRERLRAAHAITAAACAGGLPRSTFDLVADARDALAQALDRLDEFAR